MPPPRQGSGGIYAHRRGLLGQLIFPAGAARAERRRVADLTRARTGAIPPRPNPGAVRNMPVHAFIFPGQGSQAVGMGRDLAAAFTAAREVFEEIDETLKQNLSRLMFEGPGEELVLTENTQPALMAHSLAVLRVLEKEGGWTLRQKAAVVAGHSLGEYSALASAGAFAVTDAARLLKLRGQTMQKAVPPGEGAMAALLGADM